MYPSQRLQAAINVLEFSVSLIKLLCYVFQREDCKLYEISAGNFKNKNVFEACTGSVVYL